MVDHPTTAVERSASSSPESFKSSPASSTGTVAMARHRASHAFCPSMRPRNKGGMPATARPTSWRNTQITAPSGLYDQDAQTLDLYEDVQVENAKGYSFDSTSAKVFITEGRVEGIDPLQGSGPLGDVRCDTYEIIEEGDRVYCSGNVEMTITPGERSGTTSKAGNKPGNEEQGVEE